MKFITFFHTFEPTPIIATIGPVTLYWYGLFYFISILVGYFIVRRILIKLGKNGYVDAERLKEALPELGLWLVISGLIGARFYHALNEWPYYAANPGKIFAVTEGGLAIHGALVAGLLFLWLYARRKNYQFLWLLDLFAPVVLLGQAIGRWGNYFNQELFGRPTMLPWGIPIALDYRPPGFEAFTYFHPTFLYESLWGFVGMAALLWWWHRRTKHTALRPYDFTASAGSIFFTYILYMSFGRFLVELIRIDSTPFILGMRLPIIISMVLVIVGTAGLVLLTQRNKNNYT